MVVKTSKKNHRIRTGDTVKVLLGKDRGTQAKVMAVLPQTGRVLVEGINMVHKHVRPRQAGQKGQRVKVAAPFDISNVQVICPQCKKPTRVGIVRTDGKRQRQCKKCQATF